MDCDMDGTNAPPSILDRAWIRLVHIMTSLSTCACEFERDAHWHVLKAQKERIVTELFSVPLEL
jgi:hypothetical protein